MSHECGAGCAHEHEAMHAAEASQHANHLGSLCLTGQCGHAEHHNLAGLLQLEQKRLAQETAAQQLAHQQELDKEKRKKDKTKARPSKLSLQFIGDALFKQAKPAV